MMVLNFIMKKGNYISDSQRVPATLLQCCGNTENGIFSQTGNNIVAMFYFGQYTTFTQCSGTIGTCGNIENHVILQCCDNIA